MKKLLIIIILFISFSYVLAQTAPDTLWTRTYGESNYDLAFSIKQTSDEGFVFAGVAELNGWAVFDAWLVKINAEGNCEWSRNYGGFLDDRVYSVEQTADGGYILAGFTESFGAGEDDFWIIKTDALGNEEWMNTYGRTVRDWAVSITQTSDYGYIAVGFETQEGSSRRNSLIIKTDALGNEEWCIILYDDYYSDAKSVIETNDGNFVVAGDVKPSNIECNIYLLCINSNGLEQWYRTYDYNSLDAANCVEQTTDGGFIVVGYSGPMDPSSNRDYLILKTDEIGEEEWCELYTYNAKSYAESVQQTADGGYVVAGRNNDSGLNTCDYWIIKTDSIGSQVWSQTYNFGDMTSDRAESIQLTSDGGYIICGGTYNFTTQDSDAWIICLGEEVGADHQISAIQGCSILTQNYPNPFNPTTTISFSIPNESSVEVSIYNIKGQKVKTLVNEMRTAGAHSAVWNGRDSNGKPVGSGIYFYKLQAGDYQKVKKMILIK